MKTNYKSIFSVITYIFIFIGCFFLMKKIPSLTSPVMLVIEYSSYVIFGLGVILSIRFNQGRVFLIILLLFLSQLFLNYYEKLSINTTTFSEVLYRLICLLVPLNIVIISLLKERGIFSLWGKIRIALILTQLIVVYIITVANHSSIQKVVNYKFIGLSFDKLIVNQTALLLFFFTLIFLIVKSFMKSSAFEARLIGVIISIFLHLFDCHFNFLAGSFFTARFYCFECFMCQSKRQATE